MTREWVEFNSMGDLLTHLATNSQVCYQAPMDPGVGRWEVRKVTIDHMNMDRSTIKVWSRVNGELILNLREHFNRFRYLKSVSE